MIYVLPPSNSYVVWIYSLSSRVLYFWGDPWLLVKTYALRMSGAMNWVGTQHGRPHTLYITRVFATLYRISIRWFLTTGRLISLRAGWFQCPLIKPRSITETCEDAVRDTLNIPVTTAPSKTCASPSFYRLGRWITVLVMRITNRCNKKVELKPRHKEWNQFKILEG